MRSAVITGILWRELLPGLGAALAIGGMEWLSVASHYPLVIIHSMVARRASGIGRGDRGITAWRSRFDSVAQTGRRRG